MLNVTSSTGLAATSNASGVVCGRSHRTSPPSSEEGAGKSPIGKSALLAIFLSIIALPAPASAANPRTVLAQHDPQDRLPNTDIRKLGVIRVGTITYSIYYLDFANPVSLHGQQRIAIIKNGTHFAGAYQCSLGHGDGKFFVGKDRLTVKRDGKSFVIRFGERGPTRNKYFCGEGSGWEGSI